MILLLILLNSSDVILLKAILQAVSSVHILFNTKTR